MVARGAPDLERLQVWDSGDLWGSKARTVIIDKQRLQPTPSTAQHHADYHLRRQHPPAGAPDHTNVIGARLSDILSKDFKIKSSAIGTSGSDQNQTKVSTTTTTTAAPTRAAPKAAAPTKATPRMNYLIGTTSERATQPTNDTIVHKPTAAAEALIEHEMDPELERLRELMREQAAMYDALRARLNFLEHDLLNRRMQRQPQHHHRHHLHVDHQAEAQAYRLLQAARGSYQSYGHASYDTYTYGYGGGEDDYDSGEALEACSGDIIIHNHYSCGCDEPEYDGGALGGGDEESEYDLAPGEDPEFEGPTEEEYYYELDWLADYEIERAEYEDEHELD